MRRPWSRREPGALEMLNKASVGRKQEEAGVIGDKARELASLGSRCPHRLGI